MSNAILTIRPYRENGVWYFDDAELGIKAEPFVGEINLMIDDMVTRAIPRNHPEKGFTALFSEHYIPQYDLMLVLKHVEGGGATYKSYQLNLEGWLCPVLFKYFKQAPATIFVKAHPFPRKKNWWNKFRWPTISK